MKSSRRWSFLFYLLLLPCPGLSDTLQGHVIGISDGDTITVLDQGKRQHKVRLNGIDAPESSQDYGQVSKQNLSNLVFGKDVAVIWWKRDRYGRILGKVIIGERDVNLEQIRAGMSWFFRKYSSDIEPIDRSLYERTEQEARAARRGLWKQPNPIPPWDFRANHRNSRLANPPIATRPSKHFPASPKAGAVIGNRNSKIYHRPDCPDYQKVSGKNRVYFSTVTEAERAGFRRAGNCPITDR